jgi:hypothetical protein
MAALIGVGVLLGINSIDRATRGGRAGESIFFWPLFPGIAAGWILSGGPEGNEIVAYVIGWVVDTGLYWLVWMLLSWMLRKLVTRPS